MDLLLWPGRAVVYLAIEAFTVFYGLWWEALYGHQFRPAVIRTDQGEVR